MQQATTPAKPRNPVPPPEFQEKAISAMDGAALLGVLKSSSSTEFQKAKACMRVGELGVKEAIPVLASMLADEHLGVYARYGLEPIADPAVDDALRAAMGKLKGNAQIGVINSISKRRDAKAAPALSKMMHGSDVELARAAAAALGSIGGPAAVKDLQAALPKATGLMKTSVADALLVAAERYLADGKRDAGLAVYASLSAPDTPKAARMAAMSGIIREETSTSRPR
jgi:HEAT repeat protein